MKCEKINNYKLTGSIHTLQIGYKYYPKKRKKKAAKKQS